MPYVKIGDNDDSQVFPWEGSDRTNPSRHTDTSLKYPYGN